MTKSRSNVQYSFTLVQKRFITDRVFDLDCAARADRGLVRESNQDVARVIPRLGLVLVADGVGGHEHGEIASRTAADALEHSFDGLGGAAGDMDETAERLFTAFREANRRVGDHPASGAGRARMGTTLVAAVFAHGHAIIGNVGDSRCYRLRDGALERLTYDHSFAAQLERMGAAATRKQRQAAAQWSHVLTRCLSGHDGVTPDMRIVACEPGDVYLLCSDGLWASVADDMLSAILGASEDAEGACHRLVGAAWAGGGLDNIGVAVVRLMPLRPGFGKPSSGRRSGSQRGSDA